MKIALIATQIIIASTLINIWVFRYRKMIEEFNHYRLPNWLRDVTCALKLTISALLIVGIWVPEVALVATQILTILMAFALMAHARVKNPPIKFAPALSVLLLSIFLTYGLDRYLMS